MTAIPDPLVETRFFLRSDRRTLTVQVKLQPDPITPPLKVVIVNQQTNFWGAISLAKNYTLSYTGSGGKEIEMQLRETDLIPLTEFPFKGTYEYTVHIVKAKDWQDFEPWWASKVSLKTLKIR